MRRRLLCVLALGATVPALASCAADDEQVSRCVDTVAAGASKDGGSTARGVAREVERLRRLRFRSLPKPRYLQKAALARRIRAELNSYPAAAAEADERALIALGALPRGTDLRALLRKALSSQVAGSYDPKKGELVVLSDAQASLNGVERLTLAHELEHALADQALEFPAYLEADRPPEGLEDAAAAGLALVEGDAMLITEAYAVEHLSARDVLSGLAPSLAAGEEFDKLPYYVQASSVFPYTEGLAFVCRVFARGGWKAVDRAYRKPPVSTAQILFPGRYLARERDVDPPDPPPPGRGWKRLDRTAVGAADLLWLFEAPGGKVTRALSGSRRRAAAWAGGEAYVWGRGPRTAVTLTLVQRRGARDLCASVRAWLRAADRRGAVVRCSGRIVRASLRT
ncbi:MAG: hypothetical protein ABR583_04270 [Gaiellaceae bacterium]